MFHSFFILNATILAPTAKIGTCTTRQQKARNYEIYVASFIYFIKQINMALKYMK